ncbi:MAG: hypothetical protein AB1938_29440 [Myxococcota bacterium]
MNRERGTSDGGDRSGGALTRCIRGLLALLVLFAVPSAAEVPTAPGFKIGEGRLHPFLALDGRFDSVVGFFNIVGGVAQPSPEIIFHVRPGLKFDLTTDSTLVSFDGAAEYLWYTGLLSPSSTQLSRFQANVGLDAHFNKTGAVEVQVSDRLTRSDRTQNPAAGVGVISLYNNARLALPIHPGGRALEVTPSVAFGVEFFDPLLTGTITGCMAGDPTCDPTLVGQMNYGNLTFGLGGRWKFLPKTALVLDANFDYRLYFTSGSNNLPGMVLRVQTGLIGLISPRISLTLLAGYGGNLAADPTTMTSGPHTPIGHAEFAYLPSEASRLALGYVRTIQPVSSLGSFIDDRGYLQGRLGLLGGRLQLNAEVAADYFWYFQPTQRNDLILSVGVGPTFIVASWFDTTATYRLSLRDSTTAAQSVNYVRHEATLNLNFHY